MAQSDNVYLQYLDSWTSEKFPAESMKVMALHIRTDSMARADIARRHIEISLWLTSLLFSKQQRQM